MNALRLDANFQALATFAKCLFHTILLIGFGWIGESSCRADIFTFTNVIDDSSPLVNQLDFYPQLNNHNQISISYGSSFDTLAIWEAGLLTTIAETGDGVIGGGGIRFIGPNPTMNDNGTVAFRASYNTGAGVIVADGSTLTEVLDDPRINTLFPAVINSSNRVVAALENSSGDILVRSRIAGGITTTHASDASSGEFSLFQSGGGSPSADMNDAGDVALRGFLRSNFRDGIYVDTPGGLETVADTADGFLSFGNIVDINNLGMVAFLGRPAGSPSGFRNLYIGEPGETPTLIADNSIFESIAEAGLAINDVGGALFGATFGGSNGIYIGGDPINDRVIGVGDALDGGTVTALLVRRGMLNNDGNFVFYASIDDTGNGSADRNAIFFAEESAAAVPEPTSLAVGLLAVGLVARSRRARKNGNGKKRGPAGQSHPNS